MDRLTPVAVDAIDQVLVPGPYEGALGAGPPEVPERGRRPGRLQLEAPADGGPGDALSAHGGVRPPEGAVEVRHASGRTLARAPP